MRSMIIILFIFSSWVWASQEWLADDYNFHSKTQVAGGKALVDNLKTTYPDHDVKSILILGCGIGHNIPLLLANYPFATVTCYEPYQSMFEYVSHRFRNNSRVIFEQKKAQELNTENTYDLVFTSYVLHWLDTQALDSVLHKIYQALTDGGVLAARSVSSSMLKELDPIFIDLPKQEPFKTALTDFIPDFVSHTVSDYLSLLLGNNFIIDELSFRRIPIHYNSRSHFKYFVKQWLTEPQHISKTQPELGERYLDAFVDGLIKIYQLSGEHVICPDPSITLLARKS